MREGLHKIVSCDETIVAISTPLGRSGLGVVRLSGPNAVAITDRFFQATVRSASLLHRKATGGVWRDLNGDKIDEVLVTLFRAPHSYTGEDVVEISGHGNPLALSAIIQTARTSGARIAAPGEFTLRAVAHGKMDLTQAEAVREFIEAQTEQQAKTALRQMEGALSKRIRPVKESLVDIIARLEAGIDFAEDDVNPPDGAALANEMRPLSAALEGLRQSFGYGRILVQGLSLAILGKPNVGKSSIFNRLVLADRAIVTEIPGTTRDVLTESVHMDGVPLRFADTAGIHETTDVVERLGVTRSFEVLSGADVALVVLDGSRILDDDDGQVLLKCQNVRHILVINKADLPQCVDMGALNGAPKVHVSAKTGQGLDSLREAIRAILLDQKTDLADDLVLTSERQNEAIGRAIDAARKAIEGLPANIHEMVLLDLYEALSALDELTGEVVTEDILSRIFSTFCIGK